MHLAQYLEHQENFWEPCYERLKPTVAEINSIKEITKKEEVSVNQFISSAIAEKISAVLTKITWKIGPRKQIGKISRRYNKGSLAPGDGLRYYQTDLCSNRRGLFTLFAVRSTYNRTV